MFSEEERSHFPPAIGLLLADYADPAFRCDIAELNLRCATGLPGAECSPEAELLGTVDDWAEIVALGTARAMASPRSTAYETNCSEAEFRILALTTILQRHLGVTYDPRFLEGEYDARDASKLFVLGPLTYRQGTCANLPVAYVAIARRLGYPVWLVETHQHLFCRWQDGNGVRFNFEAAGRGFRPHDDEHYRTWPTELSPAQVTRNALLRNMSSRAEFACFLYERGLCLRDHWRFSGSLASIAAAARLTPQRQYLNFEWAVATELNRLHMRASALNLRCSQCSRREVEILITTCRPPLDSPWDYSVWNAVSGQLRRIARNATQPEVAELHDAVFSSAEFYGA